jgi:predicted glycosyltransferase
LIMAVINFILVPREGRRRSLGHRYNTITIARKRHGHLRLSIAAKVFAGNRPFGAGPDPL